MSTCGVELDCSAVSCRVKLNVAQRTFTLGNGKGKIVCYLFLNLGLSSELCLESSNEYSKYLVEIWSSKRENFPCWIDCGTTVVYWPGSVVSGELSITRVWGLWGRERREETSRVPTTASRSIYREYSPLLLTAAKLNKFLLLIRSTTIHHHHSLSHCTVSVISVNRAPIGPPLARSQLWTNGRARHGEYDFIISHWGACRARLSQVYKTKVVTAQSSLKSEVPGQSLGSTRQWRRE